MLIAAGGDGTALQAMRLAAPHDVPVLAINLGHLGYLADVDASRLDAALEALTRGRYTVEEWGALELRRGACEPAVAFNDVVLRRAAGARPVAIALRIEAELLARYSGDGLIVATAQGSTAYSFAAGGPIVSPALAANVLTPLAPHATFNRPLVLSAGELVEIDVLASSSRLSIEIDGHEQAARVLIGRDRRKAAAPGDAEPEQDDISRDVGCDHAAQREIADSIDKSSRKRQHQQRSGERMPPHGACPRCTG